MEEVAPCFSSVSQINQLIVLADVGIPMIFVQWPLMVGALIPVIILEALLIRLWVPLTYQNAFKGVTKANIVSTLVGIPLAWLAMLAVEYAVLLPVSLAADRWNWKLNSPIFQIIGFVIGVAWIPPTDTYWLIPAAAALLLVPCFYVSIWIERRICFWSWPALDRAVVRRGVFLSNLGSYAMLFIAACGWIIFEFLVQKRQ